METENKVISLADRAKGVSSSEDNAGSSPLPVAPQDFDWGAIMKKNNDNGSRLQTDRSKSNKGVIRSYRLKH
ncbi:MAG: hypothetical protein EOP04_32540 [Proteobacteria bacterium]|nr:MAG: hypothetical protein EOP04_32540 [Pseudomonadota bacterium]